MPAAVTQGVWWLIGLSGLIVFNGRFYVQWLASERRGRSVVPIAFWYMSSIGSLLLFAYAVYLRDPGGAFSQCFNIVVYTRNLVHVWRERGKLTQALNVSAHTLAIIIVLIGVCFTVWTWRTEYHQNKALSPSDAAANWMWLAVFWGVGQGLFFLRFLIQWLVSEYKKRSVMPPLFWYLSTAAAVVQTPYYVRRRNWVFALGMVATFLIYVRNIWLICTRKQPATNG